MTETINVTFGVDHFTAPKENNFTHTFAISGEILVRHPVPYNANTGFHGDNNVPRDIAVFFLDKRVPRTIARPRHAWPPGQVGFPPAHICPDGKFNGRRVGFGPSFEGLETDTLNVCGSAAKLRRYSDSNDWFRKTANLGDIYIHVTTVPSFNPCSYKGIVKGDSGGPLLADSSDDAAICGVAAGYLALPYFIPPFFPAWTVTEKEAGIDNSYTHDFFTNEKTATKGSVHRAGTHAIGRLGNWLGECNKYLDACKYGSAAWCDKLAIDTDGDLIIDICDSCPTVFNPEQQDIDDDPDGNGHGGLCDPCLGKKWNVLSLDNCNYEIELAAAYPNQMEPPVLAGPPGDPAVFIFKVLKNLTSFRPDVCDFVSCPQQSLSPEGASSALDAALPEIVDCAPGNPTSNPYCNCPHDLAQLIKCRWESTANLIELRPATIAKGQQVSSPEGQSPGDGVTVGMRFCPCTGGGDLTTRVGRFFCQGECGYTSAAYDTPKPWVPIQTVLPNAFGAELDLALDSLVGGWSSIEPAGSLRWDFTKLPSMMLVSEYLKPVGGLLSAESHGILMSKIVATGGTKVTSVQHPTFYQLAQTFQSGQAKAFLAISPSSFNFTVLQGFTWFFEIPIPNPGPEKYTLVGKSPKNENLWFATTSGIAPLRQPAPGMPELLDQFSSGQLRFVPASEMPSTLARWTPAGEPMLRGIALDTAVPQVAVTLTSFTPDGMPTLIPRAPCVPPRCSPTIKGNEGIVLSGSLHKLIVFGGTSDGTLAGTPNPSAWLLDTEENDWTEVPLALGARPGHIRTAVYRADDVKLYFVESKVGKTFLSRYLPRGELTELAVIHSSWAKYPREDLVVGANGDLVLAASEQPSGNEDHVLVCHHPDGQGKPKTLSVDPKDAAALLAGGAKNEGDSDANENNDNSDEDKSKSKNDKSKNDKNKQKNNNANDSKEPDGADGTFTLGPCPGDVGDDPGPKLALLARFQVDTSGKLSFVGAKHLVTPILGRPIATGDTILVPVPRGQSARLRPISFGELVPVPAGQAPQIE